MSPLPSVRVQSGKRLFSTVGVEFMGPIPIKNNHNTLKCYCCVFTSMVSYALQLEVAFDLTTGSFLMALGQFLAVKSSLTTLL